ncbi:hypothetical protein ABVF11_07510 [Pediococcus argentinicus]|uniref:hypothetical protein n=1 Tax=Pediococcus argentinicus TaxID=480391 RepID=UPI00338E354C
MENNKWLQQQIETLRSKSDVYQEQAFFLALGNAALEQQKRIEQAEGELDGRMWNPRQW